MGNTALIATLAASLVAGVALLNADYSVLASADSQGRDEEAMLSDQAASSAFEMATSELSRNFAWRDGFRPTSYLGGGFETAVTGPTTGPVRINAVGVSQDSLSTTMTGWMTRLAAASSALTVDADTAKVTFGGDNVLVSGNDHRAASWANTDVTEGNGLEQATIGLLVKEGAASRAVSSALGSSEQRVRGTNGDGDVAPGGLPSDFATMLGEVVGSPTHHLVGDQTLNTTFGSADAPAVVHIDGDATFVGGGGYGMLYIEGSFEASSMFSWEGLVIADGENNMDFKLAGNATIRGAAYVTHTSTTKRTVQIGSTETPPYTLWSPDDERGVLRAYTFGASGAGDRVEGTLTGWTGQRPANGDYADTEALAFGPDGTLYVVDNPVIRGRTTESRLYKISPDQLDGDPGTDVQLTHIGRTYLDRTFETEIHGMTFYQGKLYGVGANSTTIYDMNLSTGRAQNGDGFRAVGSPPRCNRGNDFDARSLTADGDGSVYISRTCDDNKTQLFRFDSFPTGNPRYLMTVDARLSGVGVHPDGYGYGYDPNSGIVHRIDLEDKSTTVMGQSIRGDIEDLALFFAGETSAMGLGESPRLNTFPVFEGHGTETHTVSWPTLGTVEIAATISQAWRGGRWTDSRVEGGTLADFLDDARYHNGNSWNLSGKTVDRGQNVDVEFTGPELVPALIFTPSVGSRKQEETFAFTFPAGALADDLFLYVVDVDWVDVEIYAEDSQGRAVDVSAWVKKESVDIVGTDDGKRTLLSHSENRAVISPENYGIDGETLIDEVHIPNASQIATLTLEVGSHGQRGDYLAFAFASRSLFEERGILSVTMRDNASIRYSSEAIGRLAYNIPSVAARATVETFEQFKDTGIDRMFGIERRTDRSALGVPRTADRTINGGGTAGTTGGTTGGSSQPATIYVCHEDGGSRSSLGITALTLAEHVEHGDEIGQCTAAQRSSGRSGG